MTTKLARIRCSRAFASLVAGAGALASIWPPAPPARYPHSSVTSALGGDFKRIGRDMQKVIDREREHVKAAG